MSSLSDRFKRLTGKQRFVVARVMVQLAGEPTNPLLGTLNRVAQQTLDAEADGDEALEQLGRGLVEICQYLLELQPYWQAAANEGDIVWDEGEASDYFNELFTDSAQRYLSQPQVLESDSDDETLFLTPSDNVVVMLTFVATGEIPELETDLAEVEALDAGLKSIINLQYQNKLEAIQIHFSPARFGEQLTADHVLENFPELIPL
ncbi:MAG: hypothetical protein EA395_04430 [Phormidium sp. GEM2.Bin31]|nr:DUF1517 domain-containing protein [Phormidium sp. BM_Day4_Bin.17]TVR13191.1 MAG: hypothetical protein EA395_04430 [Phormidium sp. GEM2.Bin31]UCJ14208.1 MAG: DUF1517 domain-containing protein [Phormidium sp. PBR-2020]